MKTDLLRAGGIELTFHMPNSSKDIAENELNRSDDARPVMKKYTSDIEVNVGWRTLKIRTFSFKYKSLQRHSHKYTFFNYNINSIRSMIQLRLLVANHLPDFFFSCLNFAGDNLLEEYRFGNSFIALSS